MVVKDNKKDEKSKMNQNDTLSKDQPIDSKKSDLFVDPTLASSINGQQEKSESVINPSSSDKSSDTSQIVSTILDVPQVNVVIPSVVSEGSKEEQRIRDWIVVESINPPEKVKFHFRTASD